MGARGIGAYGKGYALVAVMASWPALVAVMASWPALVA